MREVCVKTLDLPNGTMKLHKKPDRVEITDINEFLASANVEILTIIPEQVKPDLNKIKSLIKRTGKAPVGTQLIEGVETFSYKLKMENK